MSKKLIFTTALALMILGLVFAMLFFADPDVAMTGGSADLLLYRGPLLAGRMLYAWVSFVAAILIFILAVEYMAGGELSKPILLMGFGALVDAQIGLLLPPAVHVQFMWLGSLVFSMTVVLGIIWMAQIFGVFKSTRKRNDGVNGGAQPRSPEDETP